jgi:hypothetical protein
VSPLSDERRTIPRAEDPPIDIEGAWTTIYNVSVAGMCVVTARTLRVGERSAFRLTDRERGDTWDLTGEVLWAQNLVSGLNRIGIRWVEPDRITLEWLQSVVRRCGDPSDGER